MYPSNWGLEESPFRRRCDPRWFFESPMHEEALARLHFLVEQQRPLGVLLGPRGRGKSLLLDVFADQVRRAGRPLAKVNVVGLQTEELLGLVAVQIGLNPPAASPLAVLWRMVVDRICEFGYQQAGTVLLLDDVDRGSPELVTQIARLARTVWKNVQPTVLVAARPDWSDPHRDDLLELAELKVHLEAWDADDTRNFIAHSLSQVGCRHPLFEESAIARLHELAHGVPRRVSQLAEMALLAGAGQQLPRIGAETVDSVYPELMVADR